MTYMIKVPIHFLLLVATISLLFPAPVFAQTGQVVESPLQVIDNDNTDNRPFTLRVHQNIDDPTVDINAPGPTSCPILVKGLNQSDHPIELYGVMSQAIHSNDAAQNFAQEYYGVAGYAQLDPNYTGTLGRINQMVGILGQVYLSDFFSLSGGSDHFVDFAGADRMMGGHFRVLMDNKNAALREPSSVAEGVNGQVVFDNNVNEPYDVGGKTNFAVGGNFSVQMNRVRGKDLPATAEVGTAAGLVAGVQTYAPQPGYTAGSITNAYGLVGYIDDPQGAIDPNGERVALWTFGGENRLDDDTRISGTLDVSGWVNSTGGAITNNGTAWYTGAGDPNGQKLVTTGALYSQTDAPAGASPLWIGTPTGWRRLALE